MVRAATLTIVEPVTWAAIAVEEIALVTSGSRVVGTAVVAQLLAGVAGVRVGLAATALGLAVHVALPAWVRAEAAGGAGKNGPIRRKV